MKFNWFQKKLTFVIIPDANGSVVKVKLPRAAVWAAALTILLLLSISLTLYFTGIGRAVSASLRTSELHGKNVRLQEDLTRKNAAIEQLQNKVYTLSRQAAEIRTKVEEMKRLEQDLKKLTPLQGSSEALSGALPAAIPTFGMGGPGFPVSAEQAGKQAEAAGQSLAALNLEMQDLQHHLARSKQLLLEKQERLRLTPSLWPTVSRNVTSPFGYRKDPFTHKLSFHRGIDIAGKLNDPVYAAAGGTVETASYDKLHGNHVVLDHGKGLRTWYMHLNGTLVKQGDHVRKGQLIGKLGTTGRSTGPHLHYEIQLSGKSTDPGPYLPSKERKGKR